MMDLDELFKHGQEFAQSTFDAIGEFTPMWVAVTEEEELLPIVVPAFPDKDQLIHVLKGLFKQRKVVRYVQMLEGWMLDASNKEAAEQALAYAREHSLADHPDRIEVLTIEASDGVRSLFGHFRILRPDNEPPRLAPFKQSEGEGEGRFANLLGKATRH